MRVPDITKANAGFAGCFAQISSSTHETNENRQLPASIGFKVTNGNLEPTPTATNTTVNSNLPNLYNQSPYVSSADEFVQRALSSSTSAANSLELPLELQLQLQPIANANSQQLYSNPKSCDNIGNNRNTTYRCIADAFKNSNRTFIGELVTESKTLNKAAPKNLIDNLQSGKPSNPDIFISATEDSNFLLIDQHKSETELFNDNVEYQSNHGHDDDLDRYNDNNRIVYESNQEDNDEYLTSPTSTSSLSSCNSHRTYFPRGIINPNYPGFQHLAHTLSEHFVRSVTSDSYDSDMSDDEMELSVGSYNKLPPQEEHDTLNSNNNNNKNVLRMSGEEKEESKGLAPAGSDPNHNANTHCEAMEDLPENLQTVLTFLEPTKYEATESDLELQTDTKLQSFLTNYTNNETYNVAISEPPVTPDILIKNYNRLRDSHFKKESRPDLLRGVSPQHMNSNNQLQPNNVACTKMKMMECVVSKIGNLPHNLNNRTNTEMVRDEPSYGVTPVDIIGDFEQEVEREFGLLVSGYRRLSDGLMTEVNNESGGMTEKLDDAMLSNAKEDLDANQLLSTLNHLDEEQQSQTEDTSLSSDLVTEPNNIPVIHFNSLEDDPNEANPTEHTVGDPNKPEDNTNENGNNTLPKPKYQKASYDERQLPPVAIEYKSLRTTKKHQQLNSEKPIRSGNYKVPRHTTKSNSANRSLHSKSVTGSSSISSFKNSKSECNLNRKREEAEIHQYQQLISDKESILNNSRYAKMSVWAEYLKSSCKDRKNSTDLVSPSTLELFDAYKIGTEIDMETLQEHLKMAKEIEKKRRNDREEIRRRLAMGVDDIERENWEDMNRKKSIHFKMHTGINFCLANDATSDTESHSSDSETCPKLSKVKHPHQHQQQQHNSNFQAKYGAEDASSSFTGKALSATVDTATNCEDREDYNNFFTKQARLQIEARTALAQAKEMAHMQMEIERQHQRVPPITKVIRGSLERIGVQIAADKRHITRQMLTEINKAQLQILVNSMHSHIHDLNETLMHFLMERDDLHVKQDTMLSRIEELTRYICAKEHLSHHN